MSVSLHEVKHIVIRSGDEEHVTLHLQHGPHVDVLGTVVAGVNCRVLGLLFIGFFHPRLLDKLPGFYPRTSLGQNIDLT